MNYFKQQARALNPPPEPEVDHRAQGVKLHMDLEASVDSLEKYIDSIGVSSKSRFRRIIEDMREKLADYRRGSAD